MVAGQRDDDEDHGDDEEEDGNAKEGPNPPGPDFGPLDSRSGYLVADAESNEEDNRDNEHPEPNSAGRFGVKGFGLHQAFICELRHLLSSREFSSTSSLPYLSADHPCRAAANRSTQARGSSWKGGVYENRLGVYQEPRGILAAQGPV